MHTDKIVGVLHGFSSARGAHHKLIINHYLIIMFHYNLPRLHNEIPVWQHHVLILMTELSFAYHNIETRNTVHPVAVVLKSVVYTPTLLDLMESVRGVRYQPFTNIVQTLNFRIRYRPVSTGVLCPNDNTMLNTNNNFTFTSKLFLGHTIWAKPRLCIIGGKTDKDSHQYYIIRIILADNIGRLMSLDISILTTCTVTQRSSERSLSVDHSNINLNTSLCQLKTFCSEHFFCTKLLFSVVSCILFMHSLECKKLTEKACNFPALPSRECYKHCLNAKVLS